MSTTNPEHPTAEHAERWVAEYDEAYSLTPAQVAEIASFRRRWVLGVNQPPPRGFEIEPWTRPGVEPWWADR